VAKLAELKDELGEKGESAGKPLVDKAKEAYEMAKRLLDQAVQAAGELGQSYLEEAQKHAADTADAIKTEYDAAKQKLEEDGKAAAGTAYEHQVKAWAWMVAGLDKEPAARGISPSDTVEKASFRANNPAGTQWLFPASPPTHITARQTAASLAPPLCLALLRRDVERSDRVRRQRVNPRPGIQQHPHGRPTSLGSAVAASRYVRPVPEAGDRRRAESRIA